jgi:NAD(P)-dependent dehydrogenase (short-subunit alcohol dehydrogenase family)
MNLAGQRVVVVGGGSGIGLAVARQALQAGAQVVIAGRSTERLQAARAALGAQAGDGHALRCESVDARDEGQLTALFAAQAPIHHLVVTVGPGSTLQRYNSFLQQGIDDAHALFANKFWAQYLCARCAAPYLDAQGSITLFGGGAGRRPIRAMAVLAAVQAAIEGLARGMALDLAPIRVNVVAPGRIASSSFADMPAAEREAMLAKWAAGLPVGRIGQPDDAAQAALYLMTNRYTTGNVLYVDGGHYLV